MIELSGLRRYNTRSGTTRLEADIKFIGMKIPAPADKLYLEVDANFGGMLVDDTYDSFMLVAIHSAIFHKTDLRIRGNVSKRLYKNLTNYAQKILCDYSDEFSPMKIFVDGFTSTAATGNLIGAGISCGADSLSTVYDRFIREDDPDYRINALFFFNCGANGNFADPFTATAARNNFRHGATCAAELGLPIIFVDTNLHQLKPAESKETFIFFATFACILAMQNAVRRYYIAGSYSYGEIKRCGVEFDCHDLAGFGESFFLPLIQTERTEIILDGCQYRRIDKVVKLADWDIARKFLYVCASHTEDASNCGTCQKCLRTLLTFEMLGKLDDFAKIFDVEQYRRESFNYKVSCVLNADKDIFCREIVDLAAELNFPMPTRSGCYILGDNVMLVADD